MPREKNLRHYEALDGLRGVAALFVVFYHFQWDNHVTHTNALRHAFLFVDLFFMLSGFVLAASYLRRINSFPEICHFWRLRFFRIYPLHFAILMALIVLEIIKVVGLKTGFAIPERQPFSMPNTVKDIFLNLFLVHSLHTTDHLSWNDPSWSISCEAAGYVIFALATFVGLTRTKVFYALAVPSAIFCYVLTLDLKGSLEYATFDLGIVRCLAGFCLGIWVYHLTQVTRISTVSTRVLNLGAICITVWVSIALCVADGRTEIAVLPAFVLALLYFHQDRGYGADLLKTRAFRFLGRISYSIYMVHFPVMVVMSVAIKQIAPPSSFVLNDLNFSQPKLGFWVGDAMLLGVVLVVLLVSHVSYGYIEKPWREYGRKGGSPLSCGP